jgi:hypothetical protein
VTDTPELPETPETPETAAVRRLLAEARHTEPMPEDVVERMDDVLAGLRETSTAAPAPAAEAAEGATVVPLASHRRRRAAGLLVAAAAIVVGGVTVAQHLPTGGGSSTAGASAQDSSQRAPETAGGSTLGDTGASQPDGVAPTAMPKPHLRSGHLVVRAQQFGVDALAGRRLLKSAPHSSLDTLRHAGCRLPADAGQVVRATYQRAPAALLYHPPSGGSQVVDLYVCGSRQPVRSATLPAP